MNTSVVISDLKLKKELNHNVVLNEDVTHFICVLNDPVIQAFHLHDQCNVISDRYLLAIVFTYFKKAKLSYKNFNREYFFLALYLAHEMEEEMDENRWEILPWALGRFWQNDFRKFVHGKNDLWQKMEFRGIVSCKACHQVLSIEGLNQHSAFSRIRIRNHAEIKRPPRLLEPSKHLPHGPTWHHEAGRDWLLNDQSDQIPTFPACGICPKEVSER